MQVVLKTAVLLACSSTCSRSPRTGSAIRLELGQLKILQEVITLSVFVPFAVLYMRQPVKLDFLWVALCVCGAAYFVFRS